MCGASLKSFEMEKIIPKYSEDYQSLDQQIKEARKRAEEFSQNIQKTRNTEYETMRNAEEERRKWAASYEEKTVMIEQLQRELASTVEALNHERKHEKSFHTSALGNVTGIEHSLSHQRFMNSKHIPTMGSSRSPALPPPPPSVPAPEGNGAKGSLPSPVSHLNISQTIENNLRREITNLKIELEQTKNAWKDSETKITFYLSQIKQLETEINVQIQEKTHCQDRLKSLEKINLKVETELNLMKSFEEEMKKSHEETVSELQQTIETLLSERERSDRIALTQDEEMRYLREQIGKSERDRKEWEENLKQLHRKEIELLEKQHQLQERERRPQDSFVLSPVASSRSTMVSRAVAPTPSPAPSSAGGNARPQNQTKDDIDQWLNELKHDQLESEGEEGSHAAYLEPEEEVKSRSFDVRPETPPRRPPSSPLKNSNGHLLNVNNGTAIEPGLVSTEEEVNEAQGVTNPKEASGKSVANGTLTHSILDMQSYSPPRVFLSHQSGNGAVGGVERGYHDSVNGNIFLSQFHHKTFYSSAVPSEDQDQQIRRGYATDLVSEISSPGGAGGENEIHLESPERSRRSKNFSKGATTSSKKSLQIRVPSGRSPKRQSQSSASGGKIEIFDVIGYRLQPQSERQQQSQAEEVPPLLSPPAPPSARRGAVANDKRPNKTNHMVSTRSVNRSNSVPRQRTNTATPRRSTVSTPGVPTRSIKGNTFSRETRQVHPFPKAKTTPLVQSASSFATLRPQSAPSRNQQTTKREVQVHQTTSLLTKHIQRQGQQQSSSRFQSPMPSRAATPGAGDKAQKKRSQKAPKQCESASGDASHLKTKKRSEEISLSLNSDYPAAAAVWK